jgi:hypothetical protein
MQWNQNSWFVNNEHRFEVAKARRGKRPKPASDAARELRLGIKKVRFMVKTSESGESVRRMMAWLFACGIDFLAFSR